MENKNLKIIKLWKVLNDVGILTGVENMSILLLDEDVKWIAFLILQKKRKEKENDKERKKKKISAIFPNVRSFLNFILHFNFHNQ